MGQIPVLCFHRMISLNHDGHENNINLYIITFQNFNFEHVFFFEPSNNALCIHGSYSIFMHGKLRSKERKLYTLTHARNMC